MEPFPTTVGRVIRSKHTRTQRNTRATDDHVQSEDQDGSTRETDDHVHSEDQDGNTRATDDNVQSARSGTDTRDNPPIFGGSTIQSASGRNLSMSSKIKQE